MVSRATIAAFRFGTGLPLSAAAPQDTAGLLGLLTGPDTAAAQFPIPGGPTLFAMMRDEALAKQAARLTPSEAATKTEQELTHQITLQSRYGLAATLARAVTAQDAFRERLCAFWADHFTVTATLARSALANAMIEDAIRPHLAGSFPDMLAAVTLHPAMLSYLDQINSTGPNSPRGQDQKRGLNENLARELLELHTLGVGAGYDQDDVRQLAELLTGLTFNARRGFEYDRRRAEPGEEIVLGVTYKGETLDTIRRALADLALRPETARHIAGKIAVHFVSDTPDPAMVEAMAQAWQQGGGALLPVYAAMLDHPAAWVPDMTKARQPWDFLVAALRALGLTGRQIADISYQDLQANVLVPLAAMGQPWRRPRGPDGWPEGFANWITPSGLATRIDWAMTRPAALLPTLPQPADFARSALGDLASEAVLWAAPRAETQAEGVGIVLASAEFNRR